MRSFFLDNTWHRPLLAACTFLLITTLTNAYQPTSRYVLKDIEGWQVYVHKDLLPNGKLRETGEPALRQLNYGPAETRQMVTEPALSKLQKV